MTKTTRQSFSRRVYNMKRSFFQYLNEKRERDYSDRTYEINGHKLVFSPVVDKDGSFSYKNDVRKPLYKLYKLMSIDGKDYSKNNIVDSYAVMHNLSYGRQNIFGDVDLNISPKKINTNTRRKRNEVDEIRNRIISNLTDEQKEEFKSRNIDINKCSIKRLENVYNSLTSVKQDIEDRKCWQKEEKILDALEHILSNQIKVVKNGQRLEKGKYKVSRNKSGKDSDISISREKDNKKFEVEAKLTYTSSGFFKFHVKLENRKIVYVPRFGKDKNTIFNENINISNLIEHYINQNTQDKNAIDAFYDNMRILFDGYNKIITQKDFKSLNLEPISPDDVEKYVYPTKLGEVLNGYVKYLSFCLDMMKKLNSEYKNRKIDEKYIRLMRRIQRNTYIALERKDSNSKIHDKRLEKIDEKFIQDILDGTDESILERIFTRFISSVKGKNRFIKKLISITPNTGSTEPLIDAIDKYYSNVFDARYIEIGTYPFSDKETKDDMTIENLKSIIFTFGNPDMKVSDTKVEYDPLQLKQNYGDKIMDFNEISKYPATIDIGLSDGIKTFNMMVQIDLSDIEDTGVYFEKIADSKDVININY